MNFRMGMLTIKRVKTMVQAGKLLKMELEKVEKLVFEVNDRRIAENLI